MQENVELRNRLNELTLNGSEVNNPELISDILSIKSTSSKVKKRRYRELDRSCWSINNIDEASDLLVATHNSDEC